MDIDSVVGYRLSTLVAAITTLPPHHVWEQERTGGGEGQVVTHTTKTMPQVSDSITIFQQQRTRGGRKREVDPETLSTEYKGTHLHAVAGAQTRLWGRSPVWKTACGLHHAVLRGLMNRARQ